MNKKEYIDTINAHFDYEENHVDAAAEYTVITDDHVAYRHGIDRPFADSITWDWTVTPDEVELFEDGLVTSWVENDEIVVTVYLGQDEIEYHISACGLPEVPTEWIADIEEATDSTFASGGFYKMRADNSMITARYSVE